MNAPIDVAVVGAGPAGLSAAILAAREGLSVALVAPRVIPMDRRTVAMKTPTATKERTDRLARPNTP